MQLALSMAPIRLVYLGECVGHIYSLTLPQFVPNRIVVEGLIADIAILHSMEEFLKGCSGMRSPYAQPTETGSPKISILHSFARKSLEN